MPIITSKIKPDSSVYTDCYKSYNALDASVLSSLELTIPKNLQKTLGRVPIWIMRLKID